MFCQKCGKELPEGVSMCPSCGNIVTGQSQIMTELTEFQTTMQEKFKNLSNDTKINWILAFTAFNALVTLIIILKILSIARHFGRMF